ncbi:NfeD family protein [Litoribacter populi]|uniref:NfeD family protein n=1 Tax=Litoribacter populi TaxID=2598460 RepID=UPI00117BE96F|nr:NfeD family protein [Litoribacter populi]
MTWLILVTLLSVGLILVLTEIIFVPGTTVVGILGVVFTAAGVIYAFANLGTESGYWVLGIALLANLFVLILGLRSGVWRKFALTSSMTSRSFDDRLLGLEVGQEGRTISDIKPYGKAEFGDKIYEVKSESGFISPNVKVIITKLESNRIIIKQ